MCPNTDLDTDVCFFLAHLARVWIGTGSNSRVVDSEKMKVQTIMGKSLFLVVQLLIKLLGPKIGKIPKLVSIHTLFCALLFLQ